MVAPRKNRMAECHPDRPHAGRGLCDPCYGRLKRDKNFVPVGRTLSRIACGHAGRKVVGHGKCGACYAKHLRATDPKYGKAVRASEELFRRYGITAAQRDAMIVEQGGSCRLCRKPFVAGGRKPHVDHCHETGAIRGILCFSCNKALGMFGDSIAGLMRAVEYLRLEPMT